MANCDVWRNEDGAEGDVGPLDGDVCKASEAVDVAGNDPSGETGVDVLRTRSFSPRRVREFRLYGN